MSSLFQITRWDGRICDGIKFPSIYISINTELFEYLKTRHREPISITQTRSQYDSESSIIGNIAHLDESSCVLNINTLWFGYPPSNGYVIFKNYAVKQQEREIRDAEGDLLKALVGNNNADMSEGLYLDKHKKDIIYILLLILAVFLIVTLFSHRKKMITV